MEIEKNEILKTPDFNFPETVTHDAGKMLNEAQQQHDGKKMVQAMVQIALAQLSISQDNVREVRTKIDSVRQDKAITPDLQALLNAIEARMIADLNNRNTVLSQEERTQLQHDLLDSSIGTNLEGAEADSFRKQLLRPISYYEGILTLGNWLGNRCLPTLFDFLMQNYYNSQDWPDGGNSDQLLEQWLEVHRQDQDILPRLFIEKNRDYVDYEKLYQTCQHQVESGFVLEEITASDENYHVFCQYLERFPDSPFRTKILNKKVYIESKNVETSYPSLLQSSDSIHVSVKLRNVERCKLTLYRLPDYQDKKAYKELKISELKAVETRTVDAHDADDRELKVPFVVDGLKTVFSPQTFGRYIILASYQTPEGEHQHQDLYYWQYCNEMLCISDIRSFTLSYEEKGSNIFALNSETGQPLANATVSYVEYGNRKEKTTQTGSGGYANLSKPAEYRVTKGVDKFLPEQSFWQNHDNGKLEALKIDIFTDLDIYRPGETVRLSLVAHREAETKRNLLANRTLRVSFFDSNYQPIEEKTVVTDRLGAAVCDFTIPTDRMNGNFFIHAETKNDMMQGRASGSKRINVSEYKTPTFQIDLSATETTQSEEGPLQIKGQAMTYSGLPVADAQVRCTIAPESWFLRWHEQSTPPIERSFTVTTDQEGRFSYTCPKEWTQTPKGTDKLRPIRYFWHLTATCTNGAGETHTISAFIYMGRQRGLFMEETDGTLIEPGKPVRLDVKLHSSDASETSARCLYELRDKNGHLCRQGEFLSDNAGFDWQDLPSGTYSFAAHILDDAEAESIDTPLYLYREDDKVSAKEDMLWVPAASIREDEGQATLLLGNTEDCYYYFVVTSRTRLIQEGWMFQKAGMHRFTRDLPTDPDDFLNIRFYTVRHGRFYEKSVRVDCPKRETIQLKALSFRDKLIPGETEKWSFQFTDAQGKPLKDTRMMLELYNEALEHLSSNRWHMNAGYLSRSQVNSHSHHYSIVNSQLHYQAQVEDNSPNLSLPKLNLYNTRFGQFRYTSVNAALQGRIAGLSVGMSKSALRSKSQPQDNIFYAFSEDAVLEEVEIATPEMAVGYQRAGNTQMQEADMPLREGEVKVALWEPTLTTDENGIISLEFEVPNFNTTWFGQVLAYTRGLAIHSASTTLLSQKPLMVQPSLPRYLRAGDQTQLMANVLNATDQEMKGTVTIELFDPRTRILYNSIEQSFTLKAKGTETIAISCTAPLDQPYIGYRIIARNEAGNGDGEQQMLPILSDVQPVIETKPFYLQPDEKELTMKVSGNKRSKGATLEYCDNPVWYCVTALPTLIDDDAISSTAMAHNLFALALADKLTSDYPAMAEAIHEWNQSHRADSRKGFVSDDDPLTSNLQKNQELKIGSLMASPWVPAAQQQTLRMEALDKLMNHHHNEKLFRQIINKLEKLHRKDGGFVWFDCGHHEQESSVWATQTVVELMGELKQLGVNVAASADLSQMLSRAVAFLDHKTIEQYRQMLQNIRKHGGSENYSQFRSYVYIRQLFNDAFPYAKEEEQVLDTIVCRTLDDMEQSWGMMGYGERGFGALVLHRAGRSATARTIIESTRQHAVKKAQEGMHWEMEYRTGWYRLFNYSNPVGITATLLQAFAEVDPHQEELDRIRQWMLLEKQTSDWGGSSLAADAVYALLSTGTQWLNHAGFEIRIDGQTLDTSATDRRLGYVKTELPAGTRKVEISRQGGTPAWGSIYQQYAAPMTEIKAARVDELSIEKQIIGDCKVGNRVTVKLTIRCQKDLEYLTLVDERPACFEPVDQTSAYHWHFGADSYYMEVKDSKTNLFFTRLDKGIHEVSYDCFVTNEGTFSSGVATIQSQYAPQYVAHSKGTRCDVKGK